MRVFKPRALFKLSPNDSRNISDNSTSLSYSNLFNLNKINTIDQVDSGSSISIGFDYKKNRLDNDKNIIDESFRFSLGQIISEKENQDMLRKTSLNQRFSDIVGETKIKLNNNLTLTNNFLLDQNLEDLNKNRIDLDLIYPKTNFNLSFLEEKQHIGDQKYIQTKAGFNYVNSAITIGAKRNLLSNSE